MANHSRSCGRSALSSSRRQVSRKRVQFSSGTHTFPAAFNPKSQGDSSRCVSQCVSQCVLRGVCPSASSGVCPSASCGACPSACTVRVPVRVDRIMTVEKAVVARWTQVAGCETDKEVREFARAIGRKFSRFAFPDDFASAIGPLQEHLSTAHRKNTSEGAHLTRIFHQFAELWLRDFAPDSCSRPKS